MQPVYLSQDSRQPMACPRHPEVQNNPTLVLKNGRLLQSSPIVQTQEWMPGQLHQNIYAVPAPEAEGRVPRGLVGHGNSVKAAASP